MQGGPQKLGENLAAARALRSLSQKELASHCGLSQVQISYFESGKRSPTLPQLAKLAEVLEIPFEYLLSGRGDRPSLDLREIAVELRNLGIVDLKIGNARVPGAFLPAEQVVSLALAGDEPEPRIVEAMPAVLAWNVWNILLLRAYGLTYDQRVLPRLAWLADVALTIDRAEGFPGGVRDKLELSRFVKRVKRPQSPDSLGHPAGDAPLSPVSKRWNISYAGNLATFRERAEHLHSLKEKRRFWQGAGRLQGSYIRAPRIRPLRDVDVVASEPSAVAGLSVHCATPESGPTIGFSTLAPPVSLRYCLSGEFDFGPTFTWQAVELGNVGGPDLRAVVETLVSSIAHGKAAETFRKIVGANSACANRF